MKIDVDSTEPDVRIELVPLIDVIFCILTFFIVAAVTLTRQAAINVDLPAAKTGTTQMRQILVVSIDPIGQTYVEKDPVTQSQLMDALVRFRKESPDGLMVLYASRASSYNDVVRVLDLLRSVGGTRVALATLPGSSQVDQFPGSNPIGEPFNPSTLPGLTNPAPSGLSPNSLEQNSFNQNSLPGIGLPSAQPTLPSSSNNPTSPRLSAPSTQPGSSRLPLPSGAGQPSNQPAGRQ
ncbi:MAG: biopolymer transporter ExbD [Timaviella obliquedivisa GSE-PSE-MK23-08B]|nr:biopolymer transporter ExbD [Timaviella obliquedivisa GSE-PSE-MK23-08B]